MWSSSPGWHEIPTADSEKKLNLFARAQRLLRACEFDKAAGVYESIVADFDEEAEAYWGLILCKFGIEYVDDPATGNKVPTCHRSSFDSLMDDPNFDMVMECADPVARRVYREEAKQIEELRKRIIEVSAKEEPYDVFISYKELDDEGQRTLDSVIAQDIYSELTEKGYRVFFSRISLEDKLGVEYEPYIFAALNSAKVMLVVGTDYDYFNAVWVKNEWSRFLSLIAKGEKKTLIPVFKVIDAYDMPKEFRKLAAQDMGKVGAMQDLIRGVEKLLGKKETAALVQQAVQEQYKMIDNRGEEALKRGYLELEYGEFDKADHFFEEALTYNAENARAYLGKLLAEYRCLTPSALREAEKAFDHDANYQKTIRFADQALRTELQGYREACNTRLSKLLEEEIERQARQRAKEQAIRDKQREEEERRREELERTKAEEARKREPFKKILYPIGDKACAFISAGFEQTVGVNSNGKIVIAGRSAFSCSDWTEIVEIANDSHIVGLRADGTVMSAGYNYHGECDVEHWRNIVAISAGHNFTAGLRANGTVVVTHWKQKTIYDTPSNGQYKVDDWKDIVAISAGGGFTVGLKADGTVVATKYIENYQTSKYLGQCDVDRWRDIIAISAGSYHTVGLRANGTVVATGRNSAGECNVGNWTDIVAISAGSLYTVGLKADGTVVATGSNENGKMNVDKWRNTVAIAAGNGHTIGLKADGTLVATGNNTEGQCNVDSLRLFTNTNEIQAAVKRGRERVVSARNAVAAARRAAAEKAEAERKAAEAEREAKISSLSKERDEIEKRKDVLEKELPTLTGFLKTGKRKASESEIAKIESRLAEIEAELKQLG